jgi:HEAT repeat protein
MTLIALGAALVALSPLLVFFPQPRTMLFALVRGSQQFTPAQLPYLGALVGVAVAVGALTYNAIRISVLVGGWQRYLSRLERDLGSRVAARGRLSSLGYLPTGRGPLAGTPGNPTAEPLANLLPYYPRAMLTGEDGAGKTIALWRYGLDVARHVSVWRIITRRQVIPILVSLAGYVQSDPDPNGLRVRHLATLMRDYDAELLARHLPSHLRRGRVLLLFDGLDEISSAQASDVLKELAVGLPQRYRNVRVVMTCRSTMYDDLAERLPLLKDFATISLLPLRTDEVRAVLHRAERLDQLGAQRASDVLDEIERRELMPIYRRPALLVMLLDILAGGQFIPGTRAQLLDEAEELQFARVGVVDARLERTRSALGYLAVAFRLTGLAEITGAQAWNERAAVRNLLSDTNTATATLGGTTKMLGFTEKELAEAIDLGSMAGILERGTHGLGLRFSHNLLLYLAAARHMDQNDAGLGRASPTLLRPEWSEIVILWGGLTTDPAGLTERLARLAATPSGSAAAAQLGDLERGASLALALALTVAVVSMAPVAVRLPAIVGPESRADWAQHTLRDMFDRVLRYGTESPGAEQERRERLRRALRQCETSAAGEFTAALARLVRVTGVNRLLRAQAVQVLGLLASNASLTALTDLLLEPDPIVREALQRGFHLAGAEAVTPLLDMMARHAATETIHRRALEALIAVDGPAVMPILARITDPQPAVRMAAIEALGALRDRRALEPLLAALRDPDANVRLTATRALGKLGDPKAQEPLLQLLQAPGEEQRVAAVEALGALRDDRALKPLIKLLDDKQSRVRAAAAEALGHIGDTRAVAPLRKRLADKDAWAQAAAATALRALGNAPR